jgi:hypothetical protein
MQVMLERDHDQPLTGERVEVDDADLGGERSDGTTGRGASGKTPFVAAVQTTPEGTPVRVKFSRIEGFTRAAITRWGQQPLSPGSTVYSDGLSCFLECVCRRQALICWVTRRTRRRDRIEVKAISMKATRCPSVRSKMVFNRR